MLAGASVPDGEFSHRRRDGSVGYHTFTLSPVTKQGEVVGLEGFMIDLTERRRAEQTLRAISTRLELALRSANAGTWDWHIASGTSTGRGRCSSCSDWIPNDVPRSRVGGVLPPEIWWRPSGDRRGLGPTTTWIATPHRAAERRSALVMPLEKVSTTIRVDPFR